MTTIWVMCCAFLALVSERLVGDYGLALPVFPVVVFYFTVVLGWRPTAVLFLAFGTVLDLAFGRDLPVAVLEVILVQVLARYWRRHGDCRHGGAQAVAGFVVGACCGLLELLLLVLPGARWEPSLAGEAACALSEVAFGATLLLPLLRAWLDAAAEHMVFDCYNQVRDTR
jgi:uncharacterized protein YqgC (DUF456 family)